MAMFRIKLENWKTLDKLEDLIKIPLKVKIPIKDLGT